MRHFVQTLAPQLIFVRQPLLELEKGNHVLGLSQLTSLVGIMIFVPTIRLTMIPVRDVKAMAALVAVMRTAAITCIYTAI